MRTINHTGATAPYNYTIQAPDYYSMVFDPNTLLVTLSSGYSPTEEVTLVCNGITLKRNCINRVCRFDLSALFESCFNSDFAITYGGNISDPFYKTEFDVIVSALTETETIKQTLRWGTYQPDESRTPVNINFPFWQSMPLLIGSEYEYAKWKIGEGGTVITGVQLVDPFAIGAFPFIVLNGSNVEIARTTYYPVSCTDGHYLRWVDSHGVIRHYMFTPERKKDKTTEIKEEGRTPIYPTSQTDYANGKAKVQAKTKQRTFNCSASVESEIYDIVASIVSSPIVAYYTNGQWVGVTIAATKLDEDTTWTKDINFTVQLPTDNIQRR